MTSVKENVTQNGEEAPQTPVVLKVLVVVLGVAIIFMLGLIIWKVMAGDHKPTTGEPAVEAIVKASEPAESFDLNITRPAASELISTHVGPNEITLHFRSESADTLIIVNKTTGKQSRLVVPDE